MSAYALALPKRGTVLRPLPALVYQSPSGEDGGPVTQADSFCFPRQQQQLEKMLIMTRRAAAIATTICPQPVVHQTREITNIATASRKRQQQKLFISHTSKFAPRLRFSRYYSAARSACRDDYSVAAWVMGQDSTTAGSLGFSISSVAVSNILCVLH